MMVTLFPCRLYSSTFSSAVKSSSLKRKSEKEGNCISMTKVWTKYSLEKGIRQLSSSLISQRYLLLSVECLDCKWVWNNICTKSSLLNFLEVCILGIRIYSCDVSPCCNWWNHFLHYAFSVLYTVCFSVFILWLNFIPVFPCDILKYMSLSHYLLKFKYCLVFQFILFKNFIWYCVFNEA